MTGRFRMSCVRGVAPVILEPLEAAGGTTSKTTAGPWLYEPQTSQLLTLTSRVAAWQASRFHQVVLSLRIQRIDLDCFPSIGTLWG